MGEVKDYDESMFKASVGEYGATRRQCFNTVDDQTMVRDLLNAIPEWKGGTGGKLHGPLTWGIVRDDIYRAIVHFQNVRPEIPSVDGHVDPHEKTIRLLLQLAKQEPPVPPRAPVMPEVPPNVGPDPRNDPNTVFAGSNFQIKVLSGVSGGEVGGAFRYAFMIWDLDNNRAAKYSYQGVMTTWGSPVSISGAVAWSKPFTTPDAIQVDQFGGSCAHAAGGLSASSTTHISRHASAHVASELHGRHTQSCCCRYQYEVGEGWCVCERPHRLRCNSEFGSGRWGRPLRPGWERLHI